jgi:hypothetical protein
MGMKVDQMVLVYLWAYSFNSLRGVVITLWIFFEEDIMAENALCHNII